MSSVKTMWICDINFLIFKKIYKSINKRKLNSQSPFTKPLFFLPQASGFTFSKTFHIVEYLLQSFPPLPSVTLWFWVSCYHADCPFLTSLPPPIPLNVSPKFSFQTYVTAFYLQRGHSLSSNCLL